MKRRPKQSRAIARVLLTVLTLHLIVLGLHEVLAQKGSVLSLEHRLSADLSTLACVTHAHTGTSLGYEPPPRQGAHGLEHIQNHYNQATHPIFAPNTRDRVTTSGGYSHALRGNITDQVHVRDAPPLQVHQYACYLPIVLRQTTSVPRPTATVTQILTGTPTGTSTASPTEMHSATQTLTPTPTYTSTPSPTNMPTQDILVLGHITDAHIGGSWVYSQRLPVVVSLVSQEVDVMVDTGDCTDHGTAAESIEYMDLVSSNATIPWRAVMGNHDTPGIFEMYIGPLEWSWDVGGYRFIGINTEAINYTALDQSLTTEKPCIIFGHFPLSWCKPVDQSKLRQRFKTYDVPIYVAGHTHGDSLETDPYSATLLLTGGRVGLGHYRVITLRGPEVDSIVFKSAWD